MVTEHKNAKWIQAFIDGKDVEVQCDRCIPFVNVTSLSDFEDSAHVFRIKPERVYPESSLTDEELSRIYLDAKNNPAAFRAMANAAVKKHCQDQEKEGK